MAVGVNEFSNKVRVLDNELLTHGTDDDYSHEYNTTAAEYQFSDSNGDPWMQTDDSIGRLGFWENVGGVRMNIVKDEAITTNEVIGWYGGGAVDPDIADHDAVQWRIVGEAAWSGANNHGARWEAWTTEDGQASAAKALSIFGNKTFQGESSMYLAEVAAALADKAGYGQLWVKNTTPCQLWFTDDAGTDTQIV